MTEKSKNRSWKNMYNDRCESEAAQRSEVRAKRDFERKNYKPVVYDFSWLYAKNEVEAVVAPEPWQPTWNRNLYCEKCWALTTPGAGRVECITCPVVQHIGCAFQYSDEVPDVWMCDECVGTMEDSINRQKNAAADKRAVELSQRSAVLLQRQIRMFVKARFFRKLMYYVCFFQGLVRGEHGVFVRAATPTPPLSRRCPLGNSATPHPIAPSTAHRLPHAEGLLQAVRHRLPSF